MWNMRLLAVGAIVLALAIGYPVMLSHFNVSELPRERHFATGAIKPAGEVYIEPIGIDALNEAMQVRATVEPSGLPSSDEHAAADRDLRLVVIHDKTVEEINLPADQHIAAATFEVDLNEGSVAHYPMDSYRTNLSVQLFEGQTASLRLPARVTVWEGVLGYTLHTTAQPGPSPDQVQLGIDITRSGSFVLFAFCAYGAMALLGCCALAIGILTFCDVRRAEATLIGALAAIAFALPVLRNALPGAPPLGVQADMFVFLWTQLAAVISLGLLVFKWAWSGPHP